MRLTTSNLLHSLSEPDLQQRKPFLFYACAMVLFSTGALFWAYFLDWGRAETFLFHDWLEITLPRLMFVQNALRQGILPLHMADTFALHHVTNRFLTFPDLLLSPQIILLIWMDVHHFILFNTIFSFLIGGFGLTWLSRKLKLSIVVFTILFLLFNFNGYILAHISVGHYVWTAYFLFPWLVGLSLSLFGSSTVGWKWVGMVSGLLFIMLLQGGYHQFVWSLFYFGFLVFVFPHHARRVFQAAAFAIFLSAVRLLPLFMNLGSYKNAYISGYPDLYEVWNALTLRYSAGITFRTLDTGKGIGAWEFSLYVGLVGALFLIGFGIVSVVRNRLSSGSYFPLLIPLLGITALSLDKVYKFLQLLMPIPVITGERVSTRMIALALILLMVLSAVELQRVLDKRQDRTGFTLLGLGLFVVFAHDLWQNARFWQLRYTINQFGNGEFQPQVSAVAIVTDPVYLTILWIGLAVTLLTAVFIGWKIYQEQKPTVQYHEKTVLS